jgi:hypothetical protein
MLVSTAKGGQFYVHGDQSNFTTTLKSDFVLSSICDMEKCRASGKFLLEGNVAEL